MDVHKKSQKQEKEDAKFFGGKTQIASGALWGSKGDIKTEDFLIEDKYTDKNSFKFTRKIWDKISKEAAKEGLRIPLLRIDIKDIKLVLFDADLFEVYEAFAISTTATKEYAINYDDVVELNALWKTYDYKGKVPAIRLHMGGRKYFTIVLRDSFQEILDIGLVS